MGRFYYVPGPRKEVLVAAPHHGCVPRCDFYTKEFATMLAAELGASLMVGEELRPLVDLNKNPELAPSPALRELCLTYQRRALAPEVELFLEIHGHVRGRYHVEVSCGFELDPHHPLDKLLAESLASFRAQLRRSVRATWRKGLPLPPPSLGVYPLDPQVVMKAKKTYLFRKIRELQLRGRKIVGLHIEIFRDYKTGDPSAPEFACQQRLVSALAAALRASFPDTFTFAPSPPRPAGGRSPGPSP